MAAECRFSDGAIEIQATVERAAFEEWIAETYSRRVTTSDNARRASRNST
jgi:hypothetical protein